MTERDDAADQLIRAVRDTLDQLEHANPDTAAEINLLRDLHALVTEWERVADDPATTRAAPEGSLPGMSETRPQSEPQAPEHEPGEDPQPDRGNDDPDRERGPQPHVQPRDPDQDPEREQSER